MDEKTRTNPFSISNILSSHSSRDNEEREFTTTSENERDKDKAEVVEEKSSVGGSFGGIHSGRKTPTQGDLYDWERQSGGQSPEKSLTDYDRKYIVYVQGLLYFVKLTVWFFNNVLLFVPPTTKIRGNQFGKKAVGLWKGILLVNNKGSRL